MTHPDDGPPPYRVRRRDDRFEVLNRSDRVVMVCGDEASANHYAELLQSAWAAGYRQARKDRRSG